MTTDFYADAEGRYHDAVSRRASIRVEWEGLGCPNLAEGSTGQLVEHPLLKMLREHDVLIDRLAGSLKKKHRGPEPSAVLAASVLRSPAAKLRAVKARGS